MQAVLAVVTLCKVTAFVTVKVTAAPVIVKVPAATVPKVKALMVVLPVIVGCVVIAAVPISTTSPAAGGLLGVPLTTAQLVVVVHALLVVPTHLMVPAPCDE